MFQRFYNWIFGKQYEIAEKTIRKFKVNISKDKQDDRDFTENLRLEPEITAIDFSSFAPPMKNQQCTSSCGPHALITGMELMYKMKKKDWQIPLSELYNYYQVRKKEGTFPKDSGILHGRSCMKCAQKGVSPEKMFPFNLYYMNTMPKLAHMFARFWRIDTYARCIGIERIRSALLSKRVVWLAIPVTESIYSYRNGKLNYNKKENSIGGHAVCCHPSTLVITTKGNKYISEIHAGDYVLTHKSNYKRVLRVSKRKIKEEIIKIKNRYGEDLLITKEHPLFTRKYSFSTKLGQINKHLDKEGMYWVKARDISRGDILHYPFSKESRGYDYVNYDEEYFELLGVYMGDGNIQVRGEKSMRMRIRIGKKYAYLKERIVYLLNKFSVNKVGISESNREESILISVCDYELCNKIGYLCGFANQKKISEEILFADYKYQNSFLYGWFITDGCENQNNVSISSFGNIKKIHDLLYILKRLNLVYSLSKYKHRYTQIRGKQFLCKPGYDVHIHNVDFDFKQIMGQHTAKINGTYLFSKLSEKTTEPYEGYVYNLEVEEDNSYTANGISVHNCVVGFDDIQKTFKIINSWGANWGHGGTALLSYKYLTDCEWHDAWSIDVV